MKDSTCKAMSSNTGCTTHIDHIKSIFLFKNTSMSTCSGVRLALKRDTISPATENTRLAGLEVAMIAKYFLANTANVGNLHAFTFHHSRGDESQGCCCCLKKSSTSSCTGSESSMLLPGESLPRSRSKALGRSSTSFSAVVVSISCVNCIYV